VLLDPQGARELRFHFAQLLDESLGVLAATERVSAKRMVGVPRGKVNAVGVECQPLSMYAVGDSARVGIVLGSGAIGTDALPEG
jgi:hypothetical protein